MQDHPLLRTVIIDDEKSAIMLLGEMLNKFEHTALAGFADNIIDGLHLILTYRPHIVFLDIKLHEENGFELISKLKDYDVAPVFVMVTGYEQYGLEALKAGAFDYLLKPVDPNELLKVISRYREKLLHHTSAEIPKKIRFNTLGGFILVHPDEILYCKAEANYTDIFLTSQHKHTISLNIGIVERLLNQASFFRISRSIIINLKYLTEINRTQRNCVITDAQTSIPLSISYDRIKELEKLLVQ
jgi:two-component system LytT family response regulator